MSLLYLEIFQQMSQELEMLLAIWLASMWVFMFVSWPSFPHRVQAYAYFFWFFPTNISLLVLIIMDLTCSSNCSATILTSAAEEDPVLAFRLVFEGLGILEVVSIWDFFSSMFFSGTKAWLLNSCMLLSVDEPVRPFSFNSSARPRKAFLIHIGFTIIEKVNYGY